MYRTSDLYFAAYLHVSGFDFTVESADKFRRIFVFDVSAEEYQKHKQAWFLNTANVKALDYANVLKALKSLVKQA